MTDKPFIDAVGHPDPIGLAIESGGRLRGYHASKWLAGELGIPFSDIIMYGAEPKTAPHHIRLALNWIMYKDRTK